MVLLLECSSTSHHSIRDTCCSSGEPYIVAFNGNVLDTHTMHRIAVIFSTYALASAFSGLLAAAILNMDGIGGRPGWAWMFILVSSLEKSVYSLDSWPQPQEGLFSVVFGISSFFLLPNSPGTAKTLNEKEREIVTHTLLLDGISEMGNASENHSWAEFRQTFLQPHVVVISIMSFFSGEWMHRSLSLLPSSDSLPIGTTLLSLA